jgi:hypothetical protein
MATKKRKKRFVPNITLKQALAKLPPHHRKAVEEWLDPLRFRREGGR